MKDYQTARLTRLQEVRQQEKLMSSTRCDEYRKIIRFRKKKKTEVVKEDLMIEQRARHDELAFARQSSLVDTGYAHRTAFEISSNALINSIRLKLLENKMRADANERGRIATIEGNDKLLAKQNLATSRINKINLRRCAIASDREDARGTAEARVARFARELAAEKQRSFESTFSQKLLSTKTLTPQGSNRVQDRGTVRSNVNIIKYNAANMDDLMMINNCAAEERCALSRRWAAVMKEMVHRKCTASRGRAARNSLVAAHTVERIEAELSLLAAADRASCRANVARSAAAVRSGARHRETSQSSNLAFESEFIFASQTDTTKPRLDTEFQNGNALIIAGQDDDESSSVTACGNSKSRLLQPAKPLMWEAADKLNQPNSHSVSCKNMVGLHRSYPSNSYAADRQVARSCPVASHAPRPPPMWSVPFGSRDRDGDGAARSEALMSADRTGAVPAQKSYQSSSSSPSCVDDSSYSSGERPALHSAGKATNFSAPESFEEVSEVRISPC